MKGSYSANGDRLVSLLRVKALWETLKLGLYFSGLDEKKGAPLKRIKSDNNNEEMKENT